MNVWHIREDGDVIAQDLVDHLQDFYAALVPTTLLPQQWTAHFDGVAVDEATSEIRSFTPWTEITGASGQTHAPLIAQCMLTLRTSSATKSGLGRKFLGPLAATAVQSDGSMTDAARNAVQAAADVLLAASEATIGGAFGVFSREQNLFRDLIAVQARDYIGALRSRRD